MKKTLRKAAGRILRKAGLDTGTGTRDLAIKRGGKTTGDGPVFEASDGRRYTISTKQRYGLKPTWQVISGLSLLQELKGRGLLDEAGEALLVRLRGEYTITAPIEEINAAVAPYVERHRDIIIGGGISNIGKRVLKPLREEVEAKITSSTASHRRRLEEFAAIGRPVDPAASSVLEIGFISGGESIVAFDRMGFRASGLDYFYDGAFDTVSRFQEVREMTQTGARFAFGDLTKRTEFEEGEFDVIYSAQVLEHIVDLGAAFREMYRLLKPGGVMFHNWDPYFHPLGGHSFGTLDFAWGHLRLSEADFDRYLAELHPHEAEHAAPWVRGSLNRCNSQQVIQRLLVEAGFAVRRWRTLPIPSRAGIVLDSEVVRDCLEKNPHVALDDLTTQAVHLIAEKPA
ncbi:methyltransferase domain-containing protein [Sphingomonas canadensis]|uniref:Methyltransferase domain-containing protein n=1 Tax=Sphingomonas canadensis TaxID=1219257 RepID=A0ABW3HCJ6_9SPHN|nr:class I SAM-dependent methyltransferase [Sphingomonas canadensis]MCW3837118.1 class I SAM-dependent methyltransferase [Sphingomonas canadensis]